MGRNHQPHGSEWKNEFRKLLTKLKEQENNPLETRAFSYLDIISWLESKITGVPVGEIIRGKYMTRIKQKRQKTKVKSGAKQIK